LGGKTEPRTPKKVFKAATFGLCGTGILIAITQEAGRFRTGIRNRPPGATTSLLYLLRSFMIRCLSGSFFTGIADFKYFVSARNILMYTLTFLKYETV